MNNKKWFEYIKQNDNLGEIKEIIKDYSESIKEFVLSDFENLLAVKYDIDFLEQKQKENNYSKQKDGYSQLIKLINGWLLEDILRTLLKEWDCEINGSDRKRSVGVQLSNDPDLKINHKNGKKIYIEITNINKIGYYLFDDSFDNEKMKFKELRYWQGRARKYHNLKNQKNKDSENEYFIMNISDNFKSIMVKRITNENDVADYINSEVKWADYISSYIALDNEYFVFSGENMANKEIAKKIMEIIESLMGGKNEA